MERNDLDLRDAKFKIPMHVKTDNQFFINYSPSWAWLMSHTREEAQ